MRQWFLGRKDCMRRLVLRAGAEGAAHVTNPTTVLILQSQQASRGIEVRHGRSHHDGRIVGCVSNASPAKEAASQAPKTG